jgi:hypothetical protein
MVWSRLVSMDESFDADNQRWRQMLGEIVSRGLMATFDFLRWSWLCLACTSCVVIREFETPSELASSSPPLSADISAPFTGEYGGHFQAGSYRLEVTSNGDAKGYVLRAGSEPIAAVRTVFGAKPGAVWISERAPKDRRLELVAALSALLAFRPHFPPS